MRSLRARFVTGLGGTVGLHVMATSLIFLLHVVLARLLDTEGYGAYSFTLAWVRSLGIVTILGFDRLLVREMTNLAEERQYALMNGIIIGADRLSIIASVLVCLIAGTIAYITKSPDEVCVRYAFYTGLLAVPVYSLIKIRKASLQGLHQVIKGQVPEALSQPITFLLIIGLVYIFTDLKFSAPLALVFYILASGVAVVHGSRLLRRHLPQKVKKSNPQYDTTYWIRSAFPLVLISGMMIINNNLDIIMLGSMVGAKSAGLYTVATRGAGVITLVLTAANMPLGPMVAKLYAQGKSQSLQRVAVGSARVVLAISLPMAISFFVFGEWFLLLFGQEFTGGKPVLNVLCIGRLVNAAAGSVGLLLVMTGHQRDSAWGVGISTAVNVVLNATLIPIYGTIGAAIATSFSMVIWNIILVYYVHKKLGIFPTALGRMKA